VEYKVIHTLDYVLKADSTQGFGFSLKNGKPVFDHPSSEANYQWCLAHPDEVECMGESRDVYSLKLSAVGICECGQEIELTDDSCGCSLCPYCGRWHSPLGQEVAPPETWKDGFVMFWYEVPAETF